MPAPQKKMYVNSYKPRYMGVLCEPTIEQIMEILAFVQRSVENQALNLCELVIIGGVNYQEIGQIRRLD